MTNNNKRCAVCGDATLGTIYLHYDVDEEKYVSPEDLEGRYVVPHYIGVTCNKVLIKQGVNSTWFVRGNTDDF